MRNHLLKISKKIKKSHILLFGSLLVFGGIFFLSSDYFVRIKDELYSEMKIAMMDSTDTKEEVTYENVPVTENVSSDENNSAYTPVDYSKYLGVLTIPRINLKRGFYGVGSKYNNIKYNVTMVNGSSLPDQVNGNTILMAHSGDAYISYFAYLWKLQIGDVAYIRYNNVDYGYTIVNIYNVPKTGVINIVRNYNRTTLTLITCTKDSSTEQTIYILERD